MVRDHCHRVEINFTSDAQTTRLRSNGTCLPSTSDPPKAPVKGAVWLPNFTGILTSIQCDNLQRGSGCKLLTGDPRSAVPRRWGGISGVSRSSRKRSGGIRAPDLERPFGEVQLQPPPICMGGGPRLSMTPWRQTRNRQLKGLLQRLIVKLGLELVWRQWRGFLETAARSRVLSF